MPTGAAGLVVEGTGSGNVPGSAVGGVQSALARGLPVIVATRVPGGATRSGYGSPGGGAALRELGAVGAGPLSAGKARLLLMVLLAAGCRARPLPASTRPRPQHSANAPRRLDGAH